MKLESLQKEYPDFIYKSYCWQINNDTIRIEFKFTMGDIEFNPFILINGINGIRADVLKPSTIDNLAFNMGLAEIPSYWKTACSPHILIEADYLDKDQVRFWKDLIVNMGQFYCENNLPFLEPEIIVTAPKNIKNPAVADLVFDRFLVPLGGGKDSLVSLEVIKRYLGRKNNKEQIRDNIITFTLNANVALKNLIQTCQIKNVFIERHIDPRLIELNNRGYLNGHTPFSSILSVIGVALAVLFGCRDVVISQEQSSNEGNIIYRGRTINHQYSKTIEFENKFRKYSQKYLAKNIYYYSLLRPLFELQVTKIFANYSQYFPLFLSCNKSFTIKNIQNKINTGWCGACPKCLSVYLMIYPFIGHDAAIRIFGQDLFKNAGLLPLMRQLIGKEGYKPFECVGTFKEMRAALYLSLIRAKEDNSGGLPVLLQIFNDEYLSQYCNMEKESNKILNSWNNNHNLPKNLSKILKSSLESRGVLN